MAAFSFPCHVDGQPSPDFGFSAVPRKNGDWRVTIHDASLGDDLCHVDTVHCDTGNPWDVLYVALTAYREHRGIE